MTKEYWPEGGEIFYTREGIYSVEFVFPDYFIASINGYMARFYEMPKEFSNDRIEYKKFIMSRNRKLYEDIVGTE